MFGRLQSQTTGAWHTFSIEKKPQVCLKPYNVGYQRFVD